MMAGRPLLNATAATKTSRIF